MSAPQRLAFAGTPEFARQALADLHQAGFEIALVLTQPDKPAGRGMRLTPSPVKQWALDHGVEVLQPKSLRLAGKYPEEAADAQQRLRAARLDLMVVAAYGLILPPDVLEIPTWGCLNIHASLLPHWRGAAPIHRAIEAGDTETGITIMQMDAGLDTGPMLKKAAIPIAPDDSTASLHDKLARLGGQLIVKAVRERPQLTAHPQPENGVTYAHKIEKSEAPIDWSRPAVQIACKVRAFDPFPGATAAFEDQGFKIWAAQAAADTSASAPGTVLKADGQGLLIATGQGVLRATELQKPGGKRLPAQAFLQGWPQLTDGIKLDALGASTAAK